jgi:hypothetical protein
VADHPEFAGRETTRTLDGVPTTGFWAAHFTLAELKTLGAKQTRAKRPTEFDGRFRVPTLQEVSALLFGEVLALACNCIRCPPWDWVALDTPSLRGGPDEQPCEELPLGRGGCSARCPELIFGTPVAASGCTHPTPPCRTGIHPRSDARFIPAGARM